MTKNREKGIFILSLQAKDIFIANNLVADKEKIEQGKKVTGYSTKNRSGGGYSVKPYHNTFDYSLDYIKIRDLCKDKRIEFSFGDGYSDVVINVNFNYTVKVYNKNGDTYSKFGYWYSLGDFDKTQKVTDNGKKYSIYSSGVIFDDEELVGIVTNQPIENPISSEALGKYFYYDDKEKCYKPTKTTIPTATFIDDKNIKSKYNCVMLRENLYENGFYVNGKKYVRYKRSAGSSREGKCLFVDSRLIKDLRKYDQCGLKVKDGTEIDLAAYESYIALTNSSIIDTIKIKKENILLVNDFPSEFTDKVVAVRSGDGDELEAAEQDVKITNNIWDGQSLIDISLMGDYRDKGMVLLRNRFFKSCCFNTNVQQFFGDNGITSVEQLNGFTLATCIEDVKLITTPSSLKYLKFSTVEQYFENYNEDFGIVKHEKPTPYFDGGLVQSSYQMLNCLQFSKAQMKEFLKPTVRLLEQLRDNPVAVKYFINFKGELSADADGELMDAESEYNVNSKNDLILKLMDCNCDFYKSEMYNSFKQDLIQSLFKKIKRGNVLVRGTYATMCGNPIEMLYHSIKENTGESKFESIGCESLIGIGNIYNTKYAVDEALFAARNPFVTMGNCWLPVNRDNALIREYMNPTGEIVFVNSIGENILERNNGADFDSDTVALVNEPLIIELARKNYGKFLVPTSLIKGKNTNRRYTPYELADLDNKTSNNKIGEIVNLSQLLNSELWNRMNNDPDYDSGDDDIYLDICKLAVLSGCEIDSAKKKFSISTATELKKIRAMLKKLHKQRLDDYNAHYSKQKTSIKPNFMGTIEVSKDYTKNPKTLYTDFDTAMDYLRHETGETRYRFFGDCSRYLKMKDLIITDGYENHEENRHRVQSIIEKTIEAHAAIGKMWGNKELGKSSKSGLAKWYRDKLLKELTKSKLNKSTVIGLLRRIDNMGGNAGGLLLQTLLDVPEINITQYFIRRDAAATVEERVVEWNRKKSELFRIFHLTNNVNTCYTNKFSKIA